MPDPNALPGWEVGKGRMTFPSEYKDLFGLVLLLLLLLPPPLSLLSLKSSVLYLHLH